MTTTAQNPTLPSERHPMSKPQIFVHLEFGVSWSQRHTPRTHAMTYTSRNLRNSRERGAFPRQLPPPNTNFLAASDAPPHRPREHGEQSSRHYQQQLQHYHQQHGQYPQHQNPQRRRHDSPRDHDRSQQQSREQTREQRHQRRESRSDSRGLSHERGKSAPPPFHDSPWDVVPGPSASLFPAVPQPAAMVEDEEQCSWKPLPEPPSKFRLGEDGLPWSAWAWPVEPSEPPQGETDDYGEGAAFSSNRTTAVATSQERPRSQDPERVRELESLSAAMMTVDNGFENQWWYQGPRETTGWWPRDQEEPSRLSLGDALLLSAAEPPVSAIAPLDGWYAPTLDNDRSSLLDGIVSPISTISSPSRPLQRTMTTRSEELFFGTSL
jgi:hypothetical protein